MTLSENLNQTSSSIAQVVPGRLYFTSYVSLIPKNDAKTVYIDIEEQIHYDPFYDDFGPANLAVLYRFCQSINKLLHTQRPNRRIFLYTSITNQNRVNAAYLIASYMIIHHNLTAEQAYVRVQSAEPPAYIGFRDAALGPPSYLLHVQYVIQGIEKAIKFKWLDFEEFDPDEYEYFERVENGDLNWIIPGKILSFCGPHDRSYVENGYPYHSPETYFDYFRTKNVTNIVRLNKKIYDAKKFTDAGFVHHDLFFIDGSTPSDEIVLRFIEVIESSKGAVAIHCKAGLGRTGTLIACWMMKQFRLTAPQCMGWLRVCRPGSVIGPQQHFLIDKQQWCWRLGHEEKEYEIVEATIDEGKCSSGIIQHGNNNLDETTKIWNAKKALESETTIDEAGRSQGDRLCQIKAIRQQRICQNNINNNKRIEEQQPSPPSFILPKGESSSKGGQRYSSATTPIKQLKLMSTKTTTSNKSHSTRVLNFSPNPITSMMMNMQTKPAMELLKNLRTSTKLTPIGEIIIDPNSIKHQHGDFIEGRRHRTTTTRILPIQKVSVSTSSNSQMTNKINNNNSSAAVRGGVGLHRKHFSSSRLLKPYLPTVGGHSKFDERQVAGTENGNYQLGGGMNGKIGEKSSSATTSFGRALSRQYARINAHPGGGGLQPSSSTSSAQIQQVSGDQQQFNSPVEGPLAHHTNCKYELRPRNQLHLPSKFVGTEIFGGIIGSSRMGSHQSTQQQQTKGSTTNHHRSTSPTAPFPLSRHYKGAHSSASFFSRL